MRVPEIPETAEQAEMSYVLIAFPGHGRKMMVYVRSFQICVLPEPLASSSPIHGNQ